jgi:hypothetical protein
MADINTMRLPLFFCINDYLIILAIIFMRVVQIKKTKIANVAIGFSILRAVLNLP